MLDMQSGSVAVPGGGDCAESIFLSPGPRRSGRPRKPTERLLPTEFPPVFKDPKRRSHGESPKCGRAKNVESEEVFHRVEHSVEEPRTKSTSSLASESQCDSSSSVCDVKHPPTPTSAARNRTLIIGDFLEDHGVREYLCKEKFALLPQECQLALMKLLPPVDMGYEDDGRPKLSFSALNNDYFNSACNEFKERFNLGWLSPEGRAFIEPGPWMEVFLDPWKREHYEEFWGQKMKEEAESDAALIPRCPTAVTSLSVSAAATVAKAETKSPQEPRSKSPLKFVIYPKKNQLSFIDGDEVHTRSFKFVAEPSSLSLPASSSFANHVSPDPETNVEDSPNVKHKANKRKRKFRSAHTEPVLNGNDDSVEGNSSHHILQP